MNTAENQERRADWKSDLLRRLHDPLQLRLGATAILLAVAYGAVYVPLSAQVAETSQKLEQDRRRLALAGSIEQLEKQYRRFRERIPQHVDSEEWVQYLLDGIRQFPLVMTTLDRRPPRRAGPYQVVVLHVEVRGTYFDLDAFVRWLESNQRLLHVDSMKLSPSGGDVMTLNLVVSGLTG
jgi:Tfp pilus assembly protein PilO